MDKGRKKDQAAPVDRAIGAALRDLREKSSLSARQLAKQSGVSAAMISRIENAQASPSISTLHALSQALDVPMVSLFRDTASKQADFTLVRNGNGLSSTRIVGKHSHDFVNLAFHRRNDLQLEVHLVTLARQTVQPPVYVGNGVVFIYALKGEAVYEYGQKEITLRPRDSLSLDAELRHGFRELLTPEFEFLSVQAESRRWLA